MNNPATIWIDMQLPPALCDRLAGLTGLPCEHFLSRGMERSTDADAFGMACEANAMILTKDADFAGLVQRLGPPPAIVWLRCGNCSCADIQDLLDRFLVSALDLIRGGESLVEIADLSSPPNKVG